MALKITASGDAKLVVSGTATELSEIYSRLEFGLPKNGASMNAGLYNYASQALYEAEAGSTLRLDNFGTNYNVDIVAPAEQSLMAGHEGVKSQLEALGYTVEIVDLS
jgi:hypothetical protein